MAERIFNIINETYEPEASTNFFDEIEAAIGRNELEPFVLSRPWS